MTTNNPLTEYFDNNQQRVIDKWRHYFAIYHQHFARFLNQQPVLLEIGVYQGGSLQMWKHYFGEGSRICGVDLEAKCKQVEEPGIEIFIGDQRDASFLQNLAESLGRIDITIDDGGHTMRQQKATFKALYPYVAEGGFYLVEDTHTSYWREYGGGLRKRNSIFNLGRGSFIEYAKDLVDQLHGWHVRRDNHSEGQSNSNFLTEFTRSTKSIAFYDSIVLFEKAKIEPPTAEKTGQIWLPE